MKDMKRVIRQAERILELMEKMEKTSYNE